jgi:LPXTG-motif cell wall-anchored protein
MRCRSLLLVLGVLVAVFAQAPPALAQEGDDHTDDLPPVEAPEGSVGIGDGIFLTGMVITPPDGGAPRTLDAEQAAAFTQAMLAQAYFGPQGIKKDPPADVPVYRVDLSGQFLTDSGVLTVYYADDGTTPYVAFNGLQIDPEPLDPPPEPVNWFMVPPLVKEAFNGTATLADTTGAASTTSTTTPPEGSSGADEDDDSSSGLLIAGAVVAAILLAAGGVWLLRRRRGADEPPEDEGDGGGTSEGGPDGGVDAAEAEEVTATVGPDD